MSIDVLIPFIVGIMVGVNFGLIVAGLLGGTDE